MIFNFTDNYKFTTRLELNCENLEVVEKAKLLGVIIINDLTWGDNTANLVKRANARLELFRKVASFSASVEDMKSIFILYIGSIPQQSCAVALLKKTLMIWKEFRKVQKE